MPQNTESGGSGPAKPQPTPNQINHFILHFGYRPTSGADLTKAATEPKAPLTPAQMRQVNNMLGANRNAGAGGDNSPVKHPASGGGGGGGGGTASGVVGQVVQFFRGKGLSDAAIAGILGNMRVESDFNTGATNLGEGAVGLVQWEGNRDDEMRSFCAAHGLDPSSVQGQLQFIWHELSTGYSGVLNQLRHVTDPGQAAAIWDGQYEVSAGTTRQQRIASAQAFFGSGLRSDGGAAGQVGSVPAGGGGTADPLGSTKNTESDYIGAESGLGDLLKKVPELARILHEAEAGNKSIDWFTNKVEDSPWFKTHSQSVRAALAEQANDPATWNRHLQNTENSLTTLAKNLGFNVDGATLQTIATNAILTGNESNQAWLTGALGRHQDFSNVTTGQGLNGQMSTYFQQLQQMSKAYGIPVSGSTLAQYAEQIALGNGNLDHYQDQFKNLAMGKYPGLVSQIQAGQTVAQIADPYVQQYANLLELDPNAVDFNKTPLIQQALQGVPTGQGSQKALMSLSDFEKQVRTDPRWGNTQNAKDTISTALVKIGHDFGFGF